MTLNQALHGLAALALIAGLAIAEPQSSRTGRPAGERPNARPAQQPTGRPAAQENRGGAQRGDAQRGGAQRGNAQDGRGRGDKPARGEANPPRQGSSERVQKRARRCGEPGRTDPQRSRGPGREGPAAGRAHPECARGQRPRRPGTGGPAIGAHPERSGRKRGRPAAGGSNPEGPRTERGREPAGGARSQRPRGPSQRRRQPDPTRAGRAGRDDRPRGDRTHGERGADPPRAPGQDRDAARARAAVARPAPTRRSDPPRASREPAVRGSHHSRAPRGRRRPVRAAAPQHVGVREDGPSGRRDPLTSAPRTRPPRPAAAGPFRARLQAPPFR